MRCMQRTNIYLEEEQCAVLDRLAAEQGISRSEIIRRLLDEGLGVGRPRLEADLAAIDASFGALAADAPSVSRGRDARARYLDELWRS